MRERSRATRPVADGVQVAASPLALDTGVTVIPCPSGVRRTLRPYNAKGMDMRPGLAHLYSARPSTCLT